MALINTLRNKMGKIVVVAIAIAIGAFIFADFQGNSNNIKGGDEVGEIAGETIKLKEFQALIQEREANYIAQYGRGPSEAEKPGLRQQAWDYLITKHAFGNQYSKVGIDVTERETWDMAQGSNLDPGIKASFSNPETGEFDRQRLIDFINNLSNQTPEVRYNWNQYVNNLNMGRERIKYENLLIAGNYVTSVEAKKEYNAQTDVAEIKYLYVPFYAINDSSVEVTDDQLETYYNKNKKRYKVEPTRDLNYVSFPIVPSAADTAYVLEDMLEVKKEFILAENDSTFANAYTEPGTSFYNKYQVGTLPVSLKANVSNLSKGDVRGPYLDGNRYKLYKVSDIYEDTVSYAKASHILIKGDDSEAQAEARRILKEIKDGASFAAMARQYGTDGTAQKGGDLGWFKTNDMVKEFEQPIFAASAPGLLNDVVKTEFGYHIVRVDETKTNTVYYIATIEQEILASDETINVAYRKADLFLSKIDDQESFKAKAAEDSLIVLPANKLKPNDRRIGALGEARQLVQWLFRDASIGDISKEVVELDDKYVVAVMTGEVEEGYQSLEDIKLEITAKVKNEMKGQVIIEKLRGLSGTLDEIANTYGDDANVYSSSDLKLNANSLPSVGYDPKAVGIAFSLESGEVSVPFASENGVLIIKMENRTIAPDVADYSTYKNQLEQAVKGRIGFNISEAIKENADIEDKRYKFY